MPPLLRILLVCCAANLASGVPAQDYRAADSPPPPHPGAGFGQQSLAQQYLAVPPGEASPNDRSEFSRSVERYDHGRPSGLTDRVATTSESEAAPQGPPGNDHFPDRAGTSNHASPADPAGRFPVEAFGNPASRVTAASSDEEPLPATQLLPAPSIPAQSGPAEAAMPGQDTPCATDPPGQVLPAAYVSELASNQSSDDTAAEPIADDEPGKVPAAEVLPLSEPREAMPLKPPAASETEGSRRRVGGVPSITTIVGGLAVVLGIFFVVAWGMRRASPGAVATLPKQVVEVLGRATLAGRQQVHLVRCGNKLLLVSVTPEGVETLTEITDPVEVDRLAGLCEAASPNSSSAAFRRVLQQFAHEGKGTYAT